MTATALSSSVIPIPSRDVERDECHQWLADFVAMLGPDYVMMMNAYFDESGTHAGSQVVCVAGYLFESNQALRLDIEWREILSKFGVGHFHAVDCAHGVREFSALSRQQRTDVHIALINAIKRRMTIGIAVSLSDSDFGHFDLGGWHFEGAYGLCALWALSGVVAWAEKHSYQGKVSYFFEAGHRHQEQTHTAMKMLHDRPTGKAYLRFNSLTFTGKHDLRPLQAADLLAYEWYKELTRKNGPPTGRSQRRSLHSLLEQTHITMHFSARDVDQFLRKGAEGLKERFDVVL